MINLSCSVQHQSTIFTSQSSLASYHFPVSRLVHFQRDKTMRRERFTKNTYHSLALVSLGTCVLNAALPIVTITSSRILELKRFILFLSCTFSALHCTTLSTFFPFSPHSTCVKKHRKLIAEPILRLLVVTCYMVCVCVCHLFESVCDRQGNTKNNNNNNNCVVL